jgi:hypothetical protein
MIEARIPFCKPEKFENRMPGPTKSCNGLVDPSGLSVYTDVDGIVTPKATCKLI